MKLLTKLTCSTLFCCAAALASSAQASFKTLANFDGANGAGPFLTSLIQGKDGNLYGTTSSGGVYDDGVVFRMTPSGALTNIYSFCVKINCADGAFPYAGLAQGSDGNFYGTTYSGGKYSFGTIFRITPSGKLTVLHSFAGGSADGANPYSGVLQYEDNFYGTTSNGGAITECQSNTGGCGTLYKITPEGQFTLLYSFCAQEDCTDGITPFAGLIESGGTFYGTTSSLGFYGYGTVFEITPEGALNTMQSFTSAQGSPEFAGLALANGNFYGTTSFGGEYGFGTVFEVKQEGTLTTLHNFCSTDFPYCSDGFDSAVGLTLGADGLLYGTTASGGTYGYGTVFNITTAGSLTTLYAFDTAAGSTPEATLLQTRNGQFYGMTLDGGSRLAGTVYSLSVKSDK